MPEPPETTTTPPGQAVRCTLANRLEWGPTYEPGECVAGTVIELVNEQWRCDRPLSSYGTLPILVRWTLTTTPNFGDQGHIDLVAGCVGDGDDNTVDLIVESNANMMNLGSCGGGGKFRPSPGPNNLQLTGLLQGGRVCGDAHQDGMQVQSAGHSRHHQRQDRELGGGHRRRGRAGGSVFFSTTSDVDVWGGEFVSCNHGLFGAIGSDVEVVGAKFRTGRTDGSDPALRRVLRLEPVPRVRGSLVYADVPALGCDERSLGQPGRLYGLDVRCVARGLDEPAPAGVHVAVRASARARVQLR